MGKGLFKQVFILKRIRMNAVNFLGQLVRFAGEEREVNGLNFIKDACHNKI
jgi:hypothetical protein